MGTKLARGISGDGNPAHDCSNIRKTSVISPNSDLWARGLRRRRCAAASAATAAAASARAAATAAATRTAGAATAAASAATATALPAATTSGTTTSGATATTASAAPARTGRAATHGIGSRTKAVTGGTAESVERCDDDQANSDDEECIFSRILTGLLTPESLEDTQHDLHLELPGTLLGLVPWRNTEVSLARSG